jgi:heme-degrading monooxygenase HmoA
VIYEIAELKIKSELENDFLTAAKKAVPFFKSAQGCESFELSRCIETPNEFVLRVGWQTLENHTIDFRESDNFQKWRALVSDFFDEAPKVKHVDIAIVGF